MNHNLSTGRRVLRAILGTVMALTGLLLCGCSDDATLYRFIGDSIVKRWDLQNSFPTLVTENCGLSGSGLEYLKSFAGRCAGQQVVVVCGTNDCGLPDTEELARQYAGEYVDALVALNADRVYVYSIIPRRFDNDPETHLNDNIRVINRAIAAEIASRAGEPIVYLDIYDLFLDKDGLMNMNLTYDGLHPNSEGYEIFTRVLNKKIL